MIVDVSKRGDVRGRAGTRALSLLGTSPNPLVLQALGEGPGSLADLQGRGGSPGSTLRTRLKGLANAEVIVARHNGGFPRGSAEYQLTLAGEELLVVAAILERWLAESPNGSGSGNGNGNGNGNGSRPFGADGAKVAIAALVDGWSASLLRALAAKPLSVADLDSLINTINYPSLERRMAAMRLVGLVEACAANGRETPYAVTTWLRRGVAPLLAAIRWERLHLSEDSVPVSAMDVEAIFLLVMPLLELQGALSGSCRLAVEFPKGREQRLAGVVVDLEEGSVPSCTSRLDGRADAWASGSVAAWFRALIDHDMTSLEFGGDGGLAAGLVAGLHRALFGATLDPRDEVFA